jgi:hypothetical protein
LAHGSRRQKARLASEFAEQQPSDEGWALALFGGLDVVEGAIDLGTFEDRQESLRAEYARQQTLVNRGAYDELLCGGALSSGDERFMVDGSFDPGANDVTAKTLQRDVRILRRGHSGGGGSKKKVAFEGVDRAKQRSEAAVHALKPVRLPVHEVKGLTFGELCVLETRTQKFVAALLTTIHDEIRLYGAIPETKPHFVQLGNATRRFYVGLEPDVHRTFHCSAFRGAARAALVNAAHSLDCARIARIDAGWTSAAGSS